ncbi:MAG: hypothetical protein HYY46_24805 [Deltaproteobacteria bacterium]|nr:hypothetical protein [Deltaproteobacteria bacterium]
MLVCSEDCAEAEKCLLAAGCWVVKVGDGGAAVSLAERETFDAAVVVSTGKEMDLAETVFNLRDISRSMQIIIVTDQGGVGQSAVAGEIIVQATPRTQVLTMIELASYVGSADDEESVAIKKGG